MRDYRPIRGSWKFIIDPESIGEFQLSIEFDSSRAEFSSITFLNGYTQVGDMGFPTDVDILHNIHGFNSAPPTGEIDVVEIEFFDLIPSMDPTEALFKVFADPDQGDFVTVLDPVNGPITLFAENIVAAEAFAVVVTEEPTTISQILIDSPPVTVELIGDVAIDLGAVVNVTPGYTQASATVESILALTHTGTRTGVFANDGTQPSHLRDGLFVDAITYNPNDIVVDLLQAAPGDVDGDHDVDSIDIQLILGANSFGNPSGGPYTWLEGDNNGDGLVNAIDIQNILNTNLFETGSYLALPASAAIVPEPSSMVLAAIALVGLLAYGQRRRAEGPFRFSRQQ